MKKFGLAITSAICAICAAFGVMAMNNVETVSADSAAVELSATKVMKSTNNDKMLLATAVNNYDVVYEVGYTFKGEVETIVAEKTKYYTEIVTGAETWTAEEIFGASFASAGMIVWEIEYDPTQAYTYKAYAKYGIKTDEGIEMGEPDELVEYAAERTTPVADDFVENAEASAIMRKTSNLVACGYGGPVAPGTDANSIWWTPSQGNAAIPRGIVFSKAALDAVINLGMEQVKFTVTTAGGAYVGVFAQGIGAEVNWVSGNYTKVDDKYYFASGSEVIIDLVQAVKYVQTDGAGATGIKFIITNGPSFTQTNGAQQVTLSNFKFKEADKSDAALAIMKSSGTYGECGYGAAKSHAVSENGITFLTGMNYNYTLRGFSVTYAALQSLVNLGFKTVTFDISYDNASVYLMFTGNGLTAANNWMSGDCTKANGLYFVESGATVTIDLVALMTELMNDASYATAGLKVGLSTTNTAFAGTTASANVTFSNFTFGK